MTGTSLIMNTLCNRRFNTSNDFCMTVRPKARSLGFSFLQLILIVSSSYRGADKSLAQPGRKHATVTEDFDVHISYL